MLRLTALATLTIDHDLMTEPNLTPTTMSVVSTTIDTAIESINDVGNAAVDERLQRSMTAVDEICRVFVESCASLAAETNEMRRMNRFLMLEASFSPELRLIRVRSPPSL